MPSSIMKGIIIATVISMLSCHTFSSCDADLSSLPIIISICHYVVKDDRHANVSSLPIIISFCHDMIGWSPRIRENTFFIKLSLLFLHPSWSSFITHDILH